MDQARLEKYAGWLVQNKEKKGTPEFDTVANAYKSLRGTSEPTAPQQPDITLAEAGSQALQNLPKSAGDAVSGVAQAVMHPLKTLQGLSDTVAGGIENALPGTDAWLNNNLRVTPSNPQELQAGQESASAFKEGVKKNWGSWSGVKHHLAEDPVGLGLDLIPAGGIALKGARQGVKAASALNKLKVVDEAAASAVANDLKVLSKDYNLSDVSGSNQGAKGAVTKLHTDDKAVIDTHKKTLAPMLDPKLASSAEDAAVRMEAQKALASANHKVASYPVPEQIAAVEKLVGHTKQGADLVLRLKKQVETSRLYDKIHGGISQYTDVLNPFSSEGSKRFGSNQITKAALTAGGYAANPMLPVAQAGTVIGGQIIDAVTGRKSLPKLFMKQNLGKVAAQDTSGLVDVIEQRKLAETARKQPRPSRPPPDPQAPKGAPEALKPAEVPTGPLDGQGNPIHSPYFYERAVRGIKAHHAKVVEVASQTTDPQLKAILEEALAKLDDSATGHGRKNHKNRLAALATAYSKATNADQRMAIKTYLEPLATVFSK